MLLISIFLLQITSLYSYLHHQSILSMHKSKFHSQSRSLDATSHIKDFTSCILHVKDIPLIKNKFQPTSIGMPRILAGANSQEWKLWFQMRDNMIGDNVVKLSTGRIIYATSSDGVNNFKIHENSPILSPSKDTGDWFYFDSEHVGLGDVIQPGSKVQAKFQSSGNVYLMYTFGGNGEKLRLPDNQQTTSSSGLEVVGAKMEIGLAVSQDGINWSRVEGSSPFASILEKGSSPDDFDGMFIGWPTVIQVDLQYYLYYHTFNPNTKRYSVCLATSSDGLLRWVKKGPVFDGNPSNPNAFDANGASRRHIIRSPDGSFRMYYEGVCSTGKHSIGVATSRDGITWKRVSDEPIFRPASSIDAWDAGGVSSPHIVYLPDVKRWRMYYVGYPVQFVQQEGNTVMPSRTLLEYNGIGIAESKDETGLAFHRVQI